MQLSAANLYLASTYGSSDYDSATYNGSTSSSSSSSGSLVNTGTFVLPFMAIATFFIAAAVIVLFIKKRTKVNKPKAPKPAPGTYGAGSF